MDKPIIDYRVKTIFWITVTALVFVPAFAINNFIAGRTTMGWMSVLVVSVLVLQAWTIYRGRFYRLLTTAVLVPVIVLFVMAAFYYQQIIGALWCYPAVLVFYFILPRRKAIYASICLLLVAVPSAWFALEHSLATRVAVTLLAVTFFSAIFVLIIEQQQQELEEKEAQRRDSMASASHELRTPLTTTLAQVEAMRDGIRPLDEFQLATVSRSIEHMASLVDDLYLLSLADVRQLTVNKQTVAIVDTVEDALAAVKTKLADHSLQIANNAIPNVSLSADPHRLRQIIDNLLENCCRYTSSGGSIHLSVEREQHMLKFTVADSGPGVSDKQLKKLFERFYRTDQSRSRHLGGAGLGLSLIKALSEAHGGHVKAAHAKQGGLAISVFFPLTNDHKIGRL